MASISRKATLPDKQTRAYELLELAALFGEFPTNLLPRLSGSMSYTTKTMFLLKGQGLLKTYYSDGRRGLRPTITAKRLLVTDHPERFSAYLSEKVDTNHVRGDPNRRDRLYRIAEATITMKNAGVSIYRDEHPAIFSPTWESSKRIQSPAFYSSREMREYGADFFKTKGARYVGVLLTAKNIFVTYNLGNTLIKWGYKAEMRTKALVETVLCIERFPAQYSPQSIKGIILGNSMELALEILSNEIKQYFILDDNYDNFYFVTNDERGEMLIRLLCNPELCTELDEILTDDLCPSYSGSLIENDAMTEDGKPVLLAYKCDLNRIKKFKDALTMREKHGIIICFDYQAEILRQYCGEYVEFQTLDYKKTERRFFS